MKAILISILAILSYNCCPSNIEGPIKIDVILRGSYKLPHNYRLTHPNDTINYYIVEFKMTNISNNTLEFLTNSCSTASNIVIDNNAVLININKCSNNHITVVELKPFQEFSLPIILQSDNRNIYKVKLGWIYLDPKRVDPSIPGLFNRNNNAIHKNILWSNTLYLDPSGGQTYEIIRKSEFETK